MEEILDEIENRSDSFGTLRSIDPKIREVKLIISSETTLAPLVSDMSKESG